MTMTAQTTENMEVVERPEDVPAFATEDEEHRFWATHTLRSRQEITSRFRYGARPP